MTAAALYIAGGKGGGEMGVGVLIGMGGRGGGGVCKYIYSMLNSLRSRV